MPEQVDDVKTPKDPMEEEEIVRNQASASPAPRRLGVQRPVLSYEKPAFDINTPENTGAKEAVSRILYSILTRVQSPIHLAYFTFVRTTDGKIEYIPVPTQENVKKIDKDFPKLPRRIRSNISQKIPMAEKEDLNLLADWINSSWNASDKQPLEAERGRANAGANTSAEAVSAESGSQ